MIGNLFHNYALLSLALRVVALLLGTCALMLLMHHYDYIYACTYLYQVLRISMVQNRTAAFFLGHMQQATIQFVSTTLAKSREIDALSSIRAYTICVQQRYSPKSTVTFDYLGKLDRRFIAPMENNSG